MVNGKYNIMNDKTKYPIVLVHGMLLKDFKLYRSFRKIRDHIKNVGYKVYATNQDGIGSIENNAKQIKEEILKILEIEDVDKVNIIAHSKGGLDARYMISMLEMENHVASLTTLSTPHYGSKLSSTILKMPKWLAKFLAFWINLVYKIFKDKKPDILKLAYELTDTHMINFNEKVINSPLVYYQSYSASLDNKKSFLMLLPYKITKILEKDQTDGIVSVSSSTWGEYKGNIPNDYDHLKMVGAYGGKKSLKEVANFYIEIINDLKEMEF